MARKKRNKRIKRLHTLLTHIEQIDVEDLVKETGIDRSALVREGIYQLRQHVNYVKQGYTQVYRHKETKAEIEPHYPGFMYFKPKK